MTIKAVKVIRECNIIGIPAGDTDSCRAYEIARQAVPEIVEKPVLAIAIPMTTDHKKLEDAYNKGAKCLLEQLEKGKSIAFLNLGDPTIYGTYMGLHERIRDAGYEAKLLSGVPSFCAVAAALEIALGAGKEKIHILPGFYYPKEADNYDGTRILMKSAGKLAEVKEELENMEDEGKIRAYAVTNCGMEEQAVYRNIRDLEDDAGYFTTIIIKDKAVECDAKDL